MQTKKMVYLSSLVILPLVFVIFYTLRLVINPTAINDAFPQWYLVSVILTMILLERLYTYSKGVSQRPFLARDISSTLVHLFVTGTVARFFFVPALVFVPQTIFGRGVFFDSPDQLGPFWLQVPMTLLFVSFFRYWMHRMQHSVSFLWELHSYHHRVSDLKASNLLVSHPIDYALRNVLVFVVLALIGFDPLAILVGVSVVSVASAFSHCGAGVKMGFINYILVTPENHRWHHSANTPEGHRYAVNYGVGFIVWDILFGSFYLPKKDGQHEQPEKLGHPDGLEDEKNYFKFLLAPLGLWRPLRIFKKA